MASSTFPATPSSRACCSAWRPSPVLLFISLRDAFSSGSPAPASSVVPALFAPRRHPPDAADSAFARQSAPGCWDQSAPDGTATGAPVFTIAGLAEAHLLQQMLLGRRVVAACANGSSATPRDSVSKLSESLRIPGSSQVVIRHSP